MDYSLESIFADIEYKLNKVVDRMSEKALSLLKEIIEEEIYKPRVPMVGKSGEPVYERTYDFLNSAWFVTEVKKTMMDFTSTLYFDGSKMTYNPSKWQHGNQNIDRRENMADILSNFQKLNMIIGKNFNIFYINRFLYGLKKNVEKLGCQ